MMLQLGLFVVLLAAVFTWFGRRILREFMPAIFVLMVIFVFGADVFEVWLQHGAWQDSILGQFLLPEYQPGYFTNYSLYRIFLPDLLALLAAITIWAILKWLNHRKEYKLFEREEPGMAAISVLLVGYPGWVVYILVLIGVYLLWHLYVWTQGNKRTRLPLYSLWPVAGLLTVLLVEWGIATTPLWLLLKI